MKLTIHIEDAEVRALLERAQRALGDLTPVMHEIGQKYERRVLENFAKEQAPDGTPWPRLAATTLMMGLSRGKRIGKRGGLTGKGRAYLQNKQALVESGRLRTRVHYQAGTSSVKVGVAGLEYAAIHQFGGMAGRGRKVRIPARPYLAMSKGNKMMLAPQDRQMVLDTIKKHLEKI
ncbi:MAG: phage virion morphogenesis protein [Desulfuromonadaceae bacterium]|nr:phage virion morphogenesis protein [Desulfuromonadaceae bacterium]